VSVESISRRSKDSGRTSARGGSDEQEVPETFSNSIPTQRSIEEEGEQMIFERVKVKRTESPLTDFGELVEKFGKLVVRIGDGLQYRTEEREVKQ
jgi:hypothetical protein